MSLADNNIVFENADNRYGAIDGLRAFAAIGIVFMHVRANTDYKIEGFIYDKFIATLGNLTELFMIISAFGMCCGYYEKMMSGQISLEQFYKKRYKKIWPFFALLCLLDFCVSPSRNSLYEIFANLTLGFGFLPNGGNISVIGVGWFLGLVFVFYMIFPFFCFLISSKRRAWSVFGIMFLFSLLCSEYFQIRASNILCSAVYFLAGGLIFLYKDWLQKISENHKWVILVLIGLLSVAYFLVGVMMPIKVVLFSLMVIYSLGRSRRILQNRVTKFISGISLEIYLCHMVICRMLEKLGFAHLFQLDVISYGVTVLGTLGGAVVFAKVAQWGIKSIGDIGI